MADGALAGSVGYVTGGGSAIGLAAVTALLDAGAHVVVCGRSPEALEQARALAPERIRAFPMDVGDEEAWAALAAFGADVGPPGSLVAVAGVAIRGPFVEGDVADWNRMWRTNVLGASSAPAPF